MKPMKSIVLLTVGALAFSSCSKKADETQTTATGTQDTTMGAGTAGTDMNATGADAATLNAAGTDANTSNSTQTTEQGSGLGAAGAAVGAGAASDSHSHDSDFSTGEGSGSSVNDDELNSDQLGEDDEFIEDTSAVEEENLPTNRGTGASTSDTESEYVDETSSEPDDVRGGRDSRMVPKYEGVDNSSSEPDPNQM